MIVLIVMAQLVTSKNCPTADEKKKSRSLLTSVGNPTSKITDLVVAFADYVSDIVIDKKAEQAC